MNYGDSFGAYGVMTAEDISFAPVTGVQTGSAITYEQQNSGGGGGFWNNFQQALPGIVASAPSLIETVRGATGGRADLASLMSKLARTQGKLARATPGSGRHARFTAEVAALHSQIAMLQGAQASAQQQLQTFTPPPNKMPTWVPFVVVGGALVAGLGIYAATRKKK